MRLTWALGSAIMMLSSGHQRAPVRSCPCVAARVPVECVASAERVRAPVLQHVRALSSWHESTWAPDASRGRFAAVTQPKEKRSPMQQKDRFLCPAVRTRKTGHTLQRESCGNVIRRKAAECANPTALCPAVQSRGTGHVERPSRCRRSHTANSKAAPVVRRGRIVCPGRAQPQEATGAATPARSPAG